MKSRPNIGYVFVTQNDNTFTVKDFSSKYSNPIMKVGDVVYFRLGTYIYKYEVYMYLITSYGNSVCYEARCVDNEANEDLHFWNESVGISVFLTKEEADNDLKKVLEGLSK